MLKRCCDAAVQAMWYYVQPPLASLSLAASVASEAAARKLRGASLLNLLHSRYAAVAGALALHMQAVLLEHAA